jgi:hypothetical protein
MRKTRSRPHGCRHGITQHRTISPPSLYLSRQRVTTLLTRLEPLTARECAAEFTNKYFRLHHAACLQPILVGYKYFSPTLWRVIIPPAHHEPTPVPRSVADTNPFLEYFHDDITTTSLECDEILHHLGPSITSVPTTQRLPRTPLYAYKDFSYAAGDTAATVTYKDPSANNLKSPPPTKQRALPSKKQRVPVASDQVQQMQPTKYNRMTIGFNTMTPAAYMRVKSQDNNNQSHQPTARRLTWEEKGVSAPGLNLKVDGINHSRQTTAEKWAKSEANEINSLIQFGATSPIYDGPMQSERNKSSRHINQRFHVLRNNYNEADFVTKQLPMPLYEQARRDLDANESSSN